MKTNKEIFAEFMGYDAVRIGYYGSDDETVWQVENEEWLRKPEIEEQYGSSVGEYFVNIAANKIISQDDIDYENSWNDLMPVITKMFDLWVPASEGFHKALNLRLDKFKREVPIFSHIQQATKEALKFINWYNENKN